ncbi:MAG: hypothetical protein FJY35_02705 [Betaproteobacteria bacterium]|nr:hypothetical protein [Betaproteobacteria bacterium]
MKEATVVGGGPVGLVSSVLLASQGFKVLLLERERELGGLMRSLPLIDGFEFDYGTRFAPRLDNPQIDLQLCNTSGDWLEFKHLLSGTFFAGKLQEGTAFLDVNGLPPSLVKAVERDYFSARNKNLECHNAENYVIDRFGTAALSYIFEPALRKITGLSPGELSPSVIQLYGLSRLLMFSAQRTRELKVEDEHNERLAFHSRDEGLPTDPKRVFRYPRRGGIGLWTRRLEVIARRAGVVIRTGVSAKGIERLSDSSARLTLNDGSEITTSRLIWSIPGSLLLHAAGVLPPGAPPRMTSGLTLFHFVFDQPPRSELFYITNYDPDFATYRVTLYTNVQGESVKKGLYHLTVEVIQNAWLTEPPTPEVIVRELLCMGVLAPNVRVLETAVTQIRQGFPLPTPDLAAQARSHDNLTKQLFPKAVILGRGQTGIFFLRDALRECTRELSEEKLNDCSK